jgi:hypothetical protein
MYLIQKNIKQKEIADRLNRKFPKMNISQPHVAKALAGKYPSMLGKINQLIKEGGNL